MELRVISFNIRCRDDANGHSVRERAPRLYDATSAFMPDVMGFQEYTPFWEEAIDRYFGAEYELYYRYRTKTGWIETAPILWRRDRFDCKKRGIFWLSDTPEVESRGWDRLDHNRICTYAILCDRKSGEEFFFMNTHLGFGDECQCKSVRLICEYGRTLSTLPTVLTGDFNMTHDAPAYREITARMRDVNAATVNDMRPTYHGYAPDEHSELHGKDHAKLLIDYCFVGEGVRPLDYKRIDTLFDGKYPSDHFGVFALLSIGDTI